MWEKQRFFDAMTAIIKKTEEEAIHGNVAEEHQEVRRIAIAGRGAIPGGTDRQQNPGTK